jgi:hypothetical protein
MLWLMRETKVKLLDCRPTNKNQIKSTIPKLWAVLMTKFGKFRKIEPSDFLFRIVRFRQFLEQEQNIRYTQQFEDPICFEVWKRTKRH